MKSVKLLSTNQRLSEPDGSSERGPKRKTIVRKMPSAHSSTSKLDGSSQAKSSLVSSRSRRPTILKHGRSAEARSRHSVPPPGEVVPSYSSDQSLVTPEASRHSRDQDGAAASRESVKPLEPSPPEDDARGETSASDPADAGPRRRLNPGALGRPEDNVARHNPSADDEEDGGVPEEDPPTLDGSERDLEEERSDRDGSTRKGSKTSKPKSVLEESEDDGGGKKKSDGKICERKEKKINAVLRSRKPCCFLSKVNKPDTKTCPRFTVFEPEAPCDDEETKEEPRPKGRCSCDFNMEEAKKLLKRWEYQYYFCLPDIPDDDDDDDKNDRCRKKSGESRRKSAGESSNTSSPRNSLAPQGFDGPGLPGGCGPSPEVFEVLQEMRNLISDALCCYASGRNTYNGY